MQVVVQVRGGRSYLRKAPLKYKKAKWLLAFPTNSFFKRLPNKFLNCMLYGVVTSNHPFFKDGCFLNTPNPKNVRG